MTFPALTRRSSRHAGWIGPVARVGYAAKGIVFFAVGILALLVALGRGGSTTGASGAIGEIAQQPFGRIILAVVAVGLLAYVIWRFVQSAADTEDRGSDAKGIIARLGYAVSGVIYLGLAFLAGRLAFADGGSSGGGSGNSQAEATATLLAQPAGAYLVAAVGIIIIGVGLYHAYRVYTASFMESYNTARMSLEQRTWSRRIGRFGLAARGLTFLIIGGFFIQAALQSDPNDAQGLDGALRSLAEQPHGMILLGIVAAGFIAYAVYCWSRTAFRTF